MVRIAQLLALLPGLLLSARGLLAAPVALGPAPAYYWYHGCGPTAAASIVGYWDLAGLSNLFDAAGSDAYLTANVQDQISSPAHNAKYDPTPDNASLPVPAPTSIASWFRTSVDPRIYGESLATNSPSAFIGYGSYRGYGFASSYESMTTSTFTWDKFVSQINAGRPMMFEVDSDGSGSTDHFVSVFGYEDRGPSGKWYGFYDTWSEAETLLWQPFRPMAVGNAWGIAYATYVTPPFQWNVPTGSWYAGASWNSGPPASAVNDSAWIDNGGEALISSGSVAVNTLYVGWRKSGTVRQSGATSVSVAALRLGDAAGTSGNYVLSGGSLSAGQLWIANEGSGSLTVAGTNLQIAVSGRLHLGAGARLTASSTLKLRMSGTVLENLSTDASALAGLAMVDLIVQNDAATPLAIEVAGRDLGATASGWINNFALGTLTLGDASAPASAAIRLVDSSRNNPGWADEEALYVGDLVLHAPAKIDLNGLNLYYLNGGAPKQFFPGDANLDGIVDQADYTVWYNSYGANGDWGHGDFNGDELVDQADYTLWYNDYGATGAGVPEPATILLLAIGGLGMIRRRS